jgi:hypothetical protein
MRARIVLPVRALTGMRKILLSVLILTLTASAADARRRHHHRYYMREAPVMMLMPGELDARSRSRIDSPAQLVPRDWQLQPADPKWQGRRYLAPDGSAWLALYATPAANDAQARFQAVAFADGEEITYLRGEHDRLTVSGVKGDRIFYRKVMLACGGAVWRYIALDYPAQEKPRFDRFVERASRGFERIADDGCGESLFTPPQPASAPEEPKPDAKPAQPN